VWAEAFERDYAYDRTDREGKRFGDELERIGYKGALPCEPQTWKCHFELHIEQGPILEAEGKEIGVVKGGQGIRWLDVTITGQESHAGSTPMPRRKDALVAASRVIAALDQIAREHAPHAVVTVGDIRVAKPSRNVIPGEVWFPVDIRHPEEAVIEEIDRRLRLEVEEACNRDALPHKVDQLWHFPPVAFDEGCIAAVRQAAQEGGYGWREMISGPGHDSFYTARHVPTSMIFIPCKDGLSHNEAEWAEPAHLEAGANVLLRAVLQMAQV
jgi:N-carbamoyl-L-amino-acid hydrolase